MKEAVLQDWLKRDPDPRTRAELEAMITSDDHAERADRLGSRLQFGTAGLRGEVGTGPARINRLVIRETSAGLGACLLEQIANAATRGVVVTFDGRPDSRQFAEDAACVFAGMGIQVFLTTDVAATPICAYGIRQLCAAGGVAVTASHNPPGYNGYKVFWDKGAQIVAPLDGEIATAIDRAAGTEVPWMDFAEARASGKIQFVGPEFYAAYRNAVLTSPLFQQTVDPASVSIAYSPLHGVGAAMAESLLAGAGFTQFFTVASQREPDGAFPTVQVPNPEDPAAMQAVIALAQQQQTTLACASDPDADRLAVAVRELDGSYQMLSGNQVGVLLAHYLLGLGTTQAGKIPLLGTTIVSSRMLKSIAVAAGARYYETLSGCKWLANIALALEDGEHQFLFAYEEAIGYMVGDLVHDKDGLSALLAFAQMTAQLATQGKTVLSELEYLYRRHGYYITGQRCITTSDRLLLGEKLRNSPPTRIAGNRITVTEDLKTQRRQFADGSSEPIDLPPADVLIYELENDARVILRPSGTEPKLKCYYEISEQICAEEEFAAAERRGLDNLERLITAHQAELDILRGA